MNQDENDPEIMAPSLSREVALQHHEHQLVLQLVVNTEIDAMRR
jgi:hypothetical protein